MDDESAVRDLALKFYAALEDLAQGKGTRAIADVWLHSADVSSAHPTGGWAIGWEEILATWDVFNSYGKPENGGTSMRGLRVRMLGDVAYTTCVFKAAANFGGATMNCTDIFQKINGEWKMVHHHADRAPSVEQAMEAMV
jgi:ketosteroid isomerase-like protein